MKPMRVWLRSSKIKSLIEIYVSAAPSTTGARDKFDFLCREQAKLIWPRLPRSRSKEVLEATITGKIIERSAKNDPGRGFRR